MNNTIIDESRVGKEWLGHVTNIGEKTFFVNLVDMSDEDQVPQFQAEFSKFELPEFDQFKLKVGSIIRWDVGMKEFADGEKEKYSRLKLIQLPYYTKKELNKALKDATKILKKIGWNEKA